MCFLLYPKDFFSGLAVNGRGPPRSGGRDRPKAVVLTSNPQNFQEKETKKGWRNPTCKLIKPTKGFRSSELSDVSAEL